MQITIQASTRTLSKTTRERIERRLRFGLTRYEPEVQRLEIVADDRRLLGDGRNRGVRIRVRFRALPDVVVEDVESNLQTAVDRAIDRAAWAVKQRCRQGPSRMTATGQLWV